MIIFLFFLSSTLTNTHFKPPSDRHTHSHFLSPYHTNISSLSNIHTLSHILSPLLLSPTLPHTHSSSFSLQPILEITLTPPNIHTHSLSLSPSLSYPISPSLYLSLLPLLPNARWHRQHCKKYHLSHTHTIKHTHNKIQHIFLT